jgi:putative phosphoesterase
LALSDERAAVARRSIELHAGALRVVVVADTHGRPHPNSDALVREQAPHAIVHAGDIGDAAVVTALERIAPVFAVRGNIDARSLDFPEALTVDVTDAGRSILRLLVVHIGVNGPKLRAEVARLARDETARLVICGHSHVPFLGSDRGITVFNPGSAGPRRFQLPIVFGVMDVAPIGIRMRHVDCETGRDWLP